MPYDEVERVLVEGEIVTGDDGVETRIWPSQRDIARRFGVAPSLVASFAKQRRCAERKAEFKVGKPVEVEPAPADEPEAETEPRRKAGRPRKADAPLIPYEELDRLLVFGEVQVLDDGTTTTVYPSYRQLAQRFGVAPSVIGIYAKSRNCLKRREQAATRVAARTEEKLIDLRADVIAVGEDRLIQMIDNFLLGFEKALEEGRVRSDNPTDVNTLARLKAFLMGGADSRQEVRAILSLESLQERYARVMRDQRDASPAMAGVIDVRAEPVHETEQAESNTKVSVRLPSDGSARWGDFPPDRSVRDAGRQSDTFGELCDGVCEVVRLARELAEQPGVVELGDEALEARLLRAAEALEARLFARDGAEDGADGADDPEEAS